MKKLILLLIISGTFSLLDGFGILTIKLESITIIIKMIFFISIIIIGQNLFSKRRALALIILVILFIPISIISTGFHKNFEFFPTWGTFELVTVFYDETPNKKSEMERVEYYEKDYGMFNTAEKYEYVRTYWGLIEIRKEIHPDYNDLINWTIKSK